MPNLFKMVQDIFSDSVAIIEGDILLSKEQTETIMTRSGAITDVIKYWPGNTVYYTFAQDFSFIAVR